MKISNLYIGYIKEITEEKEVKLGDNINAEKVYISTPLRKTILLKSHKNSKTVKDVIYGGRYKIGNFKANEPGSKYAADLNGYYLLRGILESGYKRKHISKFKLAKIMKKRMK